MLQTCIKYFFILFCSFYFYVKLLNLKTKRTNFIIHGICSLVFALITHYIRPHFTIGILLILIILFINCTFILYKQTANTTIVSSLIALGCSYVLYVLSVLITSPFALLIMQTVNNSTSLYCITFLLVGFIQFILSTLPFHMHRLKTGMPFLKDKGTSDIGAFIAVSLLLTATLFYVIKEKHAFFPIPVFFITLCGITIFFWWKNKLTENYINKLKEREINALQSEIEQLKIYNETLAKIIHKDNKLIPAMELAVENVLIEIGGNSSQEEHEKLLSTLSQLKNISKERKGILHTCDSQAKEAYSTSAPSIDSLLQYLAAKAYSEQINFEVIISQKLHTVIPDTISEDDLRTLIADLVENALIAVKNEVKRNVLIHMHMDNNVFCIEFFDSGIPFSKEVLSKLGKQRITTHENDGGTGIGYMSTFEILRRCNASLIIDGTVEGETYTKKVAIRFDGLNEYEFRLS